MAENKRLYTKAQITEMLRLARQLNYKDDIEHWESELDKIKKEESNG